MRGVENFLRPSGCTCSLALDVDADLRGVPRPSGDCLVHHPAERARRQAEAARAESEANLAAFVASLRELRAEYVVGERNVTAPTLASFGQNFGLQDLIGKPVAIIGDVRLGGGESQAVVERLLSISGEDTITIDRKYRDPWTGQLPTRIMFVSNELPRFGDASGAIATRCLLLETRTSFLGREDKELTAHLLGELPGILNWALDGSTSLTEAGRFTEPQSSIDAVTALADLVSPTSAFVRDRCNKSPLLDVACDVLYRAWKDWADDNGQRAGSAQTFGRNLRAVVPGLKVIRPRTADGERERHFVGVDLKRNQ